tara:strand:+ start:1347 stop:2000 length:654 start_codon:yes stop_codon:yes gene_type:complete
MSNYWQKFGIFDTIEETYNFLSRKNPYSGDILHDERGRNSIWAMWHYMNILRKYSNDCEHITEMGINQCVSTWAFLINRPNKLISIDIDLSKNPTKHLPEQYKGINIWLESAQKLAEENDINFEVIESDTREIEIEETDLLFIDTDHTYDCLSKELMLHGKKVKKYIIMHDTVLFASELQPAIDKFLDINVDWCVYEVIPSSPGLTILKNKRHIDAE